MLTAFGDSFIFGSDLNDCNADFGIYENSGSKLVWPCLLANKLSVDCDIFAQPGCSNQVIADDVFRVIADKQDTTIYLINWTWIDRFSFHGPKPYFDRMPRCIKPDVWSTVTPTQNSSEAITYYKHYHSEFGDKIQNLQTIYAVIKILQQYKCKFLMTYLDELLLDQTYHAPTSVQLLQENVQPFLQNYNGSNFLQWSKSQNLPISDNWHPLEESHQKAAEYWLPTVKHLLNTHAKEDYLHAFK
jgi:hypothetical protein